jgi:hypothetical protein
MDLDDEMMPYSPSADSSPSSSDLDTEVTKLFVSFVGLVRLIAFALTQFLVFGSRRGPSSRTGARPWGR